MWITSSFFCSICFFVQENTGCVDTFWGEIGAMTYVTFVSETLAKDLQWHLSESYKNKLVPEDSCKMGRQQSWRGKVLLQNTKLEGNANDKASKIGKRYDEHATRPCPGVVVSWNEYQTLKSKNAASPASRAENAINETETDVDTSSYINNRKRRGQNCMQL